MFNCICTPEYDEPLVYNVATRTARKEHYCCECGETIAKEVKYEHVKGCWDGSWNEFRTCSVCVAIRKDFTASGCGFVHGGLWEMLHDVYCWDTEWLG